MRYMTFIIHSEDYRQEEVPKSLFEAMGKFAEENQKSGVFIDGAGLQPTREGFRVRLAKGKLNITDGPFTETKEVIGGYAVIEAKTKEEAIGIATKFMDLHRIHWPTFEGTCEVRPFEAELEK